MSQIKTFQFNKDQFEQINKYKFGRNWPAVYILENGKEIYIGESTNVYNRSKQHFENPEKARLKKIHVISDEEFNKSATLDIESWLIQYISAEGTYVIQNKNDGLRNHNYYEREKYKAKFELTWEKLKKMSLVSRDLIQIKNSDVFKYSPYKSLTEDQIYVAKKLFKNIQLGGTLPQVINGRPGTGKTILAVYLMKYLKEHESTKHLEIGLVVPMTSLRNTIRKVFSKVAGLKSGYVIGPNDVTKKKYDVLIVDEAHRLKQRVNITNYQSFDTTNKKLGLGKEGTELDWILASSKQQIFFYDKNQSVRPSDVAPARFAELASVHYDLVSQLRVEGGEAYLGFVENLFDLQPTSEDKFSNYDFKIYDDIHKMVSDIKQCDAEHHLSRMLAGYAWSWSTKDGNGGHDIEIDGIKLVWNSTNTDWVNSTNAVNEVGCIHTVQGYDLNYAGVIIGPELTYNKTNNKLKVNPEKYKDINGKRSITDPNELERYVINIYKTLLTRGIKGTYVYIVDDNLREYFTAALRKKSEVKKVNVPLPSPYVEEMINLPLFDSVGCGELMFADSTVQEMIPVKASWLSRGSKYFVLRTTGDSMNQAGIEDGDLVLCRKDYHPENGNIVVALIGDDATIKEYNHKGDIVVLKPHSSNPRHQPMSFTENDEIKVQGIFIRVLEKHDD